MSEVNPTRTPFKQMKSTVAVLRGAVLPILATLKAESLDAEQLTVVSAIILAHEYTSKQLKSNPSRAKMLTLCLAWYRLADKLLPVIADQPALADSLKAILKEVDWVQQINPDMRVPKETSI